MVNGSAAAAAAANITATTAAPARLCVLSRMNHVRPHDTSIMASYARQHNAL